MSKMSLRVDISPHQSSDDGALVKRPLSNSSDLGVRSPASARSTNIPPRAGDPPPSAPWPSAVPRKYVSESFSSDSDARDNSDTLSENPFQGADAKTSDLSGLEGSFSLHEDPFLDGDVKTPNLPDLDESSTSHVNDFDLNCGVERSDPDQFLSSSSFPGLLESNQNSPYELSGLRAVTGSKLSPISVPSGSEYDFLRRSGSLSVTDDIENSKNTDDIIGFKEIPTTLFIGDEQGTLSASKDLSFHDFPPKNNRDKLCLGDNLSGADIENLSYTLSAQHSINKGEDSVTSKQMKYPSAAGGSVVTPGGNLLCINEDQYFSMDSMSTSENILMHSCVSDSPKEEFLSIPKSKSTSCFSDVSTAHLGAKQYQSESQHNSKLQCLTEIQIADFRQHLLSLLPTERQELSPKRLTPMLKTAEVIPIIPGNSGSKKPKAQSRQDPLFGEYRVPKKKKPRAYITSAMYSFLERHLASEFGLGARIKAEDFVVFLCANVDSVIRRKKGYLPIVESIMKRMFQLKLIKKKIDFHVFVEKFLPPEFRKKAIPCFASQEGPQPLSYKELYK